MSAIDVIVRLKGDGSGLVGQMQAVKDALSGVAGAERGAASAATDVTSATTAMAAANDDAATAMRSAAAAANDNAKALQKAAADGGQYASMAAQLRAAIDPMYAAQQRFNQQMDAAELLLREGVIAEREYAAATAQARLELQKHAQAVAGNSNAVEQGTGRNKQAAAGYVNLGRQMQDVAVMAQGGMSLGSIISTQGGQIADAVQQMGGRFSGLAAFLAGPWGAAVIVGTSLLANLASGLLHTGDAAEDELEKLKKNAQQTDATRHAKEIFAKSEDGVRNAILDQKEALDKQAKSLRSAAQQALETANANYANEMRIRNATKAMLEQALAQEAIAAKNVSKGGDGTVGGDEAAFGALQGASKRTQALTEQLKQQNAALAAAANNRTNAQSFYDVEEGKKAADPLEVIKKKYEGAGGLIEQARSRAVAEGLVGAALQQQVAAIVRQEKAEEDAAKKRSQKPKDPTASAVKVADGVEQQLAEMANQYANLPTAVEKANAALLKLDAIQKKITERAGQKGGGVINLAKDSADIQTLRDAINQQLNKPFEDYQRQAAEAAAVDKLLIAGREDEAAALKVVLGLQKQQGPLSEAQTSAVLATVEAERKRALVLRDQKALIQANVQAATSMRAALVDSVSEALKGRATFDKILSSVGNSYLNIMSQRLVESMFGDSLRGFEDAATRNFREATETTADHIQRLGDVVEQVSGRIGGGTTISPALSGSDLDAMPSLAALRRRVMESAGYAQDITVTGTKSTTTGGGDGGVVASQMLGLLNSTVKGALGVSLPKQLLDGIKPVFSKLETVLPGALQGAFTGSAASKLILGSGSSSVGAGIGGAIGETMGKKFLSAGLETIGKGFGAIAGPLGGIVGGLLGGVLGDLFTTAKAGTTVITGANKSSTTASTADVASGLTTMGNSISSSLTAIANKFGTTVGDFAVSIGQYKDYFRVSASGSSNVGDKYYPNNAGSDILYDGTDQNQAVLIAIQNAIADGAVRGLSKAVQKALASSTNIENAVNEALKVQQVELAIGGIGATFEKSMREAQSAAEERLRIATDYGLDLVAVEKVNAEARLKLQQDLATQQVGSLQTLLDEMSSGSLFEGSLVEQRAAILDKITAAKADVAAGKDGAGDTLAKLLEQLNTVSKEAYGSTSAYAADRTLIEDLARDTIAQTNKQISDAQSTVDALATTNSQLDESNDQLAKIAEATGMTVEYLKQLLSSGVVSTSTLADLAKTS